jgi:hypothetical protein
VLVRRSAGCLALAAALVACGGEKTTAPPVTASSVSIAPDNPSLSVGATIALTATARDAAGTVLTGRTVAWTTSQGEVATVNATTGVVTAVSPGVAIIRATIDQKFDQVLVTVVAPVASVQITARRVTVGASGGTSQLTATTRDASGATLIGRGVTWTSSDDTKARVSQAGLVTGVGVGRVTITATSEGVAGTVTIDVVDVPPPQITAISPATLTPGATVTIDGAHFDTNVPDLDVTIAGLLVPVTAATSAQLTVQMPAFVPCQPTQNTTVSVMGVGGAVTRAHPLKVAQQRSVAVGEMLLLGGVDLRCNELPPTPARYALAVINASRSPSTIASFEFRGQAAAASASAAPAAVSTRASLSWARAGGLLAPLLNPFRRAALALQVREHMAHLERERELVRRLGRPARAARRVSAGMQAAGTTALSQRSAAPVPLEVGQTTTLKIRTSDVNCTDFRNIPARVVYVGSKSVVLESTDAPLANTMDADYVALGKEYDDVMHGVLTQYFGDPLAYDDSTDKNGKIVMLFTKAVNDRAANLMGFVTACDLWPAHDPRTTASNEAEIFYARVPTSTETNYNNINSRAGWMHNMRATVIHEAKHITAFAEIFATPEEALPEESWLEEGTAQAAVEFWGRATYYPKAPWKGNATYENTMRCDNRPTDPACGGQPSIITDHFLFLFGYYENIEAKSYFNDPRNDVTVYGSGWLLTRWAADHYASDEAAFFQALTRSWQQRGLANIEARTGRDFDSLHPDFMMSLYADDVAGLTPPAGARYTIPSWNTRDMFLGISQNFTRGGEPVPAFPLRVRAVPFGQFTVDVAALSGGAAAYVELSGTPSGPQILDLRAPGGTALQPHTSLRLAILRLQ